MNNSKVNGLLKIALKVFLIVLDIVIKNMYINKTDKIKKDRAKVQNA